MWATGKQERGVQGWAVTRSTPHSPHSSEKEPTSLKSAVSIPHPQSDRNEYDLVRFQGPNREKQAGLHEDQHNPSARPAVREEDDEHMKAMERIPLTNREREVVRESLERAYDRVGFLLTPQVIQSVADDETMTEGEDADVSRVSFS